MVNDRKNTVLKLSLIPLLSVILFCSKEIIAFIPNVELVSFLIILYTKHLKWKTVPIIYIFVLLEGLIYGFGLHFIMYLYVWTILFFAVMLLKFADNTFILSLICGIYGLLFGVLCSFPYLFIGGTAGAISWIISGIPFDLIHGISSFVLTLVLWKPLNRLFAKLTAPFE